MDNPRYIVLEVMLLESGGPIGTVGEPRMLCRYHAAHLPGTLIDDGKVSVVVRDDTTRLWQEYVKPTTVEQARDIAGRLTALGFPGRTLEAKGVVDTSDGWTHLLLRVQWERHSLTLDINMQSSGFEGTDAEQLRDLCRQLFALAGFEGYCPVVYGSRLTRHGT